MRSHPMMDLDHLSFEVERFDWQADQLEIRGRWYGVHGRRFVRPTLHARVDGRRRRMLALLDHKPWSPDEAGTWIAAFAWRGEREELTSARLEVAPDIVFDLPLPGAVTPGTMLTPRAREARKPSPRPTPTAPKKPPAAIAPRAPVAAAPPADLARCPRRAAARVRRRRPPLRCRAAATAAAPPEPHAPTSPAPRRAEPSSPRAPAPIVAPPAPVGAEPTPPSRRAAPRARRRHFAAGPACGGGRAHDPRPRAAARGGALRARPSRRRPRGRAGATRRAVRAPVQRGGARRGGRSARGTTCRRRAGTRCRARPGSGRTRRRARRPAASAGAVEDGRGSGTGRPVDGPRWSRHRSSRWSCWRFSCSCCSNGRKAAIRRDRRV